MKDRLPMFRKLAKIQIPSLFIERRLETRPKKIPNSKHQLPKDQKEKKQSRKKYKGKRKK